MPIIYPNWAEGGTRTFTLNHATSARAGVMTAADKNKLDALPAELVPQSDRWGEGDNGVDKGKRYVWSQGSVNQNDMSSRRSILTFGQTRIFQEGGKLKFRRGVWTPEGVGDTYSTADIPTASHSADGAMSVADKQKLDALPAAVGGKGWSTFDFNREWLTKLSNAGIYGRNANQMRAVNGVFSLSAGATDTQIKAALTEYSTKSVLTRTDLEYCAANGCALWDEQTQGFVQVTHNGGGFFNLVELSMGNYQDLPKLRFVGLRTLDNGTWTVTRPGQQERICYKSEFDALAARVAALEGREN